MRGLVAAALLLATGILSPAAAADRLAEVEARGLLRCGLAERQPGLALQGADGVWSGFDVDVCRALAAAVLGDAGKLTLVALDGGGANAALAEGTVDLVARLPAASDLGAKAGRFVVPLLFDGQGFLVRRAAHPGNLLGLSRARICIIEEQARRSALEGLARRRGLEFTIAGFPNGEAAARAFLAGDCAALSDGRLALARWRSRQGDASADFEIMPDMLAPDPTGPFVQADESRWLELVRWAVFALIEAEERRITRSTVTEIRESTQDPAVRRLLGAEGNIGESLGLAPDWALQMVRQVGSYGEIYARHLGGSSPLALERGPNALWRDGGLLQAMPFQ